MLILKLFKDAFEIIPTDCEIKKFLDGERHRIGNREFTEKMLYWCGNRSYNQFLDYGLLALKIAKFFSHLNLSAFSRVSFSETVIEMTNKLLYDDRHDMYQNVPSCLQDIIEKSTKEEEDKIYEFFAESLIECFNVAGNGDIVYKSKIEEK